jgi:hypothetical protein
MGPTRALAVATLVLLLTVQFGGWVLLRSLTGRGEFEEHEQRLFATGHSHAGTGLVLALAYLSFLGRTDFSDGAQWIAGVLLLVGVVVMSGGFFVQMKGSASQGATITRVGSLLIGAALIMLAIGLAAAD